MIAMQAELTEGVQHTSQEESRGEQELSHAPKDGSRVVHESLQAVKLSRAFYPPELHMRPSYGAPSLSSPISPTTQFNLPISPPPNA